MTIEEAIRHALNGNAILFLGSGFCKGAINAAGREFPLGGELCSRMIKDGGIDVSEDSTEDQNDCEYIAERYLETNQKMDLVRFLTREFTCETCTKSHETIAAVNWKKIYTTNYDDVMELASRRQRMTKRTSVTPETSLADIAGARQAIIHMNGYVGNITEKNVVTTVKLTKGSYQLNNIQDNDWAINLKADIQTSKSVIFIGYSMDYDIDLQRIFAESEDMKSKTIFISWKETKRMRLNMEKFGEIESIGVDGFADRIEQVEKDYVPEQTSYELKCLRQVQKENVANGREIRDSEIIDLFFQGKISMKNIYSTYGDHYIISRDCCENICKNICGNYRAIIVHSDIGNRKTVLFRKLETELVKHGSVYYVENLSQEIQDDMDYICTLPGLKFIFVENYNRIIDSEYVKILSRYQQSDIRFLFTVRSYLNDNLYRSFLTRFHIQEEAIWIEDINELSNGELTNMCRLLDEYSLWGTKAGDGNAQKMQYLRKTCHSEMKSIMLDLLKSQNMQRKIKKLLDTLFENQDIKEITLLLFICNTLTIDIELNDILILLNKQAKSSAVIYNQNIREFFDFRKNRVEIKSPLVAYYVLKTGKYDRDVEQLLMTVFPVLDRNSYIDKYRNALRMLISYSNLQMIFGGKGDAVFKRYERIFEKAKNLNYHKQNPFFWLQYAIVRMEMKQYKTAGVYLANAEAYSKKKFNNDSWQIEINKARLLMEQTMAENNTKDSFENFVQAYSLLHESKTVNRFYPFRQVSLFEPYYKQFYDAWGNEEKNVFLLDTIEMQKSLKKYLDSQAMKNSRNHKRREELRGIVHKLEMMRREMVDKDTQA